MVRGGVPGSPLERGSVLNGEIHAPSWYRVDVTRMIVRLAFAATLSIVASAGQSANPRSAAPPDLQTIGPQVGVKVPSFTLPDQDGQPRSLESLLGPKGAMLVFFRSADW
jgi:cytochrome oxidase Cu insertion factor (SCO1/SenC/PrrC family)